MNAKIKLIVQRWKSPLSVKADYFEAIGSLATLQKISLKLKGKLEMFSSLFLDICSEKCITYMNIYIFPLIKKIY